MTESPTFRDLNKNGRLDPMVQPPAKAGRGHPPGHPDHHLL